jgi:hypothetical protein
MLRPNVSPRTPLADAYAKGVCEQDTGEQIYAVIYADNVAAKPKTKRSSQGKWVKKVSEPG